MGVLNITESESHDSGSEQGKGAGVSGITKLCSIKKVLIISVLLGIGCYYRQSIPVVCYLFHKAHWSKHLLVSRTDGLVDFVDWLIEIREDLIYYGSYEASPVEVKSKLDRFGQLS